MSEKVPVVKTSTVSKIVIVPYKDKTYQTQVKDNFALPINPETYSKSYKVEYDLRRGHGQEGTDPKFKSTAPEELKLEFVFDGTGTVEGYTYPDKTVQEQIDLFLKTVYHMDGDIHRPRFLKIFWDELRFPCILTNLDLNYTLFDPDGKPLRAKASASFTNYIEQEAREARNRKKSPDLTQKRQVKGGDRLDLLTYRIYDDSNFFLQVAKANGLTSLRNVKEGLDILLPPFDKTEI